MRANLYYLVLTLYTASVVALILGILVAILDERAGLIAGIIVFLGIFLQMVLNRGNRWFIR